MKAAENEIMRSVGEDELIARAAACLARETEKHAAPGSPVAVVAGTGNNGCDGLECALLLLSRGYRDITVFLSERKPNAGVVKRTAELKARGARFGVDFCQKKYAVVLDCLFGTGLSRAPSGGDAALIESMNESGAVVISADVPSGLNAADGSVPGACVNAAVTVSFGGVKCGLVLGEGRNHVGEIVAADIGVAVPPLGRIADESDGVLPPRKPVSHKGNYGKVAVVGGSDVMPGAPLMCFESAVAASRCGAGLTTLCAPSSLRAAYQSRVKETMLHFLPDENGKIAFSEGDVRSIFDRDAIAIGCGAGRGEGLRRTVEYLLHNYTGTLVADADALNVIAEDPAVMLGHKCKLVLTPHVVEFSRLCGEDAPHFPERILEFARRYDCTVAVKSATTVISDGSETVFNLTGTPALSKGGSGDVLGGMVAALCCVLPPFRATVAACYHFGLAGERAVKRLSSVTSVMASDVIIELVYAE